jgi:hypothetical protein
LGCEVDHTTPSSAEVRNEWIYICAPPICFHSVARDNFTFSVFIDVFNFRSYINFQFLAFTLIFTGPFGKIKSRSRCM